MAKYQAAYDPSRPLAALPRIKQEDALKQIAIKIKTAVFDNPRPEPETAAGGARFPLSRDREWML